MAGSWPNCTTSTEEHPYEAGSTTAACQAQTTRRSSRGSNLKAAPTVWAATSHACKHCSLITTKTSYLALKHTTCDIVARNSACSVLCVQSSARQTDGLPRLPHHIFQ